MLKILFILLYALGIGWFLYRILPEPTNQDDEDTIWDTMGSGSTDIDIPATAGTDENRVDKE